MLNLFLASFVVISIAVLAMSVGVIVSGRRIKGSCGGLNSIEGLEGSCGICDKPCEKRQRRMAQLQASANKE